MANEEIVKRRKVEEAAQTAIVASNTSSQLAEFRRPGPFPKPKKKILEEDTFVEALEKIITRDFFPDLPKLQAQNQYLEAVENGDLDKLRDIQVRYQTPLNGSMTPAAFEESVPKKHDPIKDEPQKSTTETEQSLDTSMSLNDFLAKYTSEDNSSFEEIIQVTQDRIRKRYKHLYEPSEKQRLSLTMPTDTKLAIKDGGVSVPLDTWQHTPANNLMFPLLGAALTPAERLELVTKGPVKINHSATRFTVQPFPGGSTRGSMTTGSATDHTLDGLGPNNPLISNNGSDSPKVNGFGFVVTPSPAPGIDDMPMMTWGMIDGTPFRLDGGSVAASPGPVFKIPETSHREKLGLQLAEKVHQKHRKERVVATTPSVPGTPSALSRMSPAAQKLSRQMLKNTPGMSPGIFGSTPSHASSRSRTPLLTPARAATPRVLPGTVPVAEADVLSAAMSVTDDLLS